MATAGNPSNPTGDAQNTRSDEQLAAEIERQRAADYAAYEAAIRRRLAITGIASGVALVGVAVALIGFLGMSDAKVALAVVSALLGVVAAALSLGAKMRIDTTFSASPKSE